MKPILVFGFILASLFTCIPSQARIYIQVDQPSEQKFPLAVPDLILKGEQRDRLKWHRALPELLRKDLVLSGLFEIIPPKDYPQDEKSYDLANTFFNEWNLISTHALVLGTVEPLDKEIIVDLRLYDTVMGVQLAGQHYKVLPSEMARVVHHFADEILLTLTGERGPFSTQIAFTHKTRRGVKEIFVSDIDGQNLRQVTSHRTTSISPTWDPKGRKLAYSCYVDGYPELFMMNLKTGLERQITDNKSVTLTPAWSPDGVSILAPTALGGEIDLYLYNPEAMNRRRVSPAFGIDINPSWSPDGTEFVFASERAGKLHLFKANADGTQVKRLTYVGYQSDNPSWSPKGDKIAFQSRDQGVFDIFIMNADGSQIQRLTALAGDNENPTWDPSGRYIIFSSTRSGEKKLMMMLADGGNPVELPIKINGSHAAWGPWVDQ